MRNDPLHAPMSHEARELELYAENDGGLYKSMLVPIQRALSNRKANGTYSSARAVTAFMHFIDAAAQKYAREDGFRGSRKWHDIFPIGDRRLVAARFAREFEIEYKLGNYNHLLNETARKRAIAAGRLPSGKSPGQIERATLLRRGTSESNRVGSRPPSLSTYRHSKSPYYYTVLVPYAKMHQTRWHPTEATGPFSVLARGTFNTKLEARAWGNANLNGTKFSIRRYAK